MPHPFLIACLLGIGTGGFWMSMLLLFTTLAIPHTVSIGLMIAAFITMVIYPILKDPP